MYTCIRRVRRIVREQMENPPASLETIFVHQRSLHVFDSKSAEHILKFWNNIRFLFSEIDFQNFEKIYLLSKFILFYFFKYYEKYTVRKG